MCRLQLSMQGLCYGFITDESFYYWAKFELLTAPRSLFKFLLQTVHEELQNRSVQVSHYVYACDRSYKCPHHKKRDHVADCTSGTAISSTSLNHAPASPQLPPSLHTRFLGQFSVSSHHFIPLLSIMNASTSVMQTDRVTVTEDQVPQKRQRQPDLRTSGIAAAPTTVTSAALHISK
jgi:hypothetical protein